MNNKTFSVVSPSDGQVIGQIPVSLPQEIDQKVARVRTAFLSWSQFSLQDRIKYIQRFYDECVVHKQEIAQTAAREMGMPVAMALEFDVGFGLEYMRGYIHHASSWLEPEMLHQDEFSKHVLYFQPYGIVGISIPWNYPFCNFVWAVIQNVIVGNTVVIKHSEHSAMTAQLLEKIFQKINFPSGVCEFVYGAGDVGDYLMHADIDMIWFTGSTKTGNKVYQVAAQKNIPAILELGGSAPGIIFKDVDLPSIIPFVYLYRFINSGQTCDGLKRLIVHESIVDQVVQQLTAIIRTKKIGDPLELTTDIGPLVSIKQAELLQEQVADAVAQGAKIVVGGKRRPGAGAYFEPTIIINVKSTMRVWQEEVFGPVLPVLSFSTEQEAIDLANDTQFGLGAYVYTKDESFAARVCDKLQTGNVSVNAANYVIPEVPFGGYKLSGIGRIHGKLGMRSLCLIKAVSSLI